MADAIDEADVPERTERADETPKRSRKWLFIGGGVLLVIIIAVVAAFTIGGHAKKPASGQDTATTSASQPKTEHKPQKKPIFYAFAPAFVVNFKDKNAIRYLQVEVQVLTHDPSVVDAIKTYAPVIRNNLLMLFSSQTYKTLASRADKEKLRGETLAAINKVLKAKTGAGRVDAVYFTKFVMQ